MNCNHLKEIIKLICIFFHRQVLSIGLMKSKVFRYFFVVIYCVVIGLMSFIIYTFFSNVNSSAEQTRVVIDSYSCSIFLWTFVSFMFVKILFIKKGNFIRFTIQMPLTKRERNLVNLIIEVIITLLIVFSLSISVVIAVLCREGAWILSRLICNILFNSITTYFVLELLYSILTYLCNCVGFGTKKDVIILCFLSMLFILFYTVIVPDFFVKILYTFKEHTATANILFYTVISEKYNMALSVLLFAVIVVCMGMGILQIPDNGYGETKSYLKIRKRSLKTNHMLGMYMLAFMRKNDNIVCYFVTAFIFIVMQAAHIKKSYYVILIMTFNSFYAYIQTERLRFITIQKKYSPVKDYVLLIFSQTICIMLLSLPIDFIYAIMDRDIRFFVTLSGSILISVIFMTMTGILFPAKNENPFSFIIGVTFMLVISVVLFLICFGLNIKPGLMIFCIGIICLLSCLISVMGLKRLYQINRYYKR